jgi:hypothetical protein
MLIGTYHNTQYRQLIVANFFKGEQIMLTVNLLYASARFGLANNTMLG